LIWRIGQDAENGADEDGDARDSNVRARDSERTGEHSGVSTIRTPGWIRSVGT
jgi:hypothetical protein